MADEIEDYAEKYDNEFRVKKAPRSLISRKSRAIVTSTYDEETGEWRKTIRMARIKFGEEEKGIFLTEYQKWGRMGESAATAGVSPQTVRKAMEEDEDFAEAVLLAEQAYKDKLIGHHQDLVFNGTVKKSYDRNGNLVSEETIYPIRLIELELKKHDSGYREKQEISHQHSGGVLIAPAEAASIEDWEKKYKKRDDEDIIDITPNEEE